MKKIVIYLLLLSFFCFTGNAVQVDKEKLPDERLGKEISIPAGNYYVGSDEKKDEKPLARSENEIRNIWSNWTDKLNRAFILRL